MKLGFLYRFVSDGSVGPRCRSADCGVMANYDVPVQFEDRALQKSLPL